MKVRGKRILECRGVSECEDADEAAAWVFCGWRWYLPDVPQNKELAVQTSPDSFLLDSTHFRKGTTHAFSPSVLRRGNWGFPRAKLLLVTGHSPLLASTFSHFFYVDFWPWLHGGVEKNKVKHSMGQFLLAKWSWFGTVFAGVQICCHFSPHIPFLSLPPRYQTRSYKD